MPKCCIVLYLRTLYSAGVSFFDYTVLSINSKFRINIKMAGMKGEVANIYCLPFNASVVMFETQSVFKKYETSLEYFISSKVMLAKCIGLTQTVNRLISIFVILIVFIGPGIEYSCNLFSRKVFLHSNCVMSKCSRLS